LELIEARKAAHYTQAQAAERLGISRPTYRHMEAFPGSVSVEDAKRIAKLFNVSVEKIFFSDNDS
jgi:DNA-binding XRE family transcriptional regulator